MKTSVAQTSLSSSTKTNYLEWIAKSISFGLNPLILGPVMLGILFNYEASAIVNPTLFWINVLLFFSIIPLLLLLTFKHFNKIETIDVRNRSNRHFPFLFGIASYLTGSLIILHWFDGKGFMSAAIFALLTASILCALITLKWKISIHNAAASISVSFLFMIAYQNFEPIFLFFISLFGFAVIVSMIWSRVFLGAHTLAESVAGALCGILVSVFFIGFSLI